MNNFQKVNAEDLMEIKGGKIYHNTPWQICNSRTHKCWADNAAIARTCGNTIITGWLKSIGR